MITTVGEFTEVLSKIAGFKVESKESKLILTYEKGDIKTAWELEKVSIEEILDSLSKKKIEDETILYDEYTYEILVKFPGIRPFLPFSLRENGFKKEDKVNKISYELSKPTEEYMLFFLKLMHLEEIYRFPRLIRIIDENEVSKLEFFEFLWEFAMPRIFTLKIKSEKPKDLEQFSKLAMAFLFNLSYNLDTAVIEIRFLHELFRHTSMRIKRSRLEELEPPRRIYIPDLIYHYQMAISTDSPPLKFLAFYHIIEHFFYDVYNEELLNEIKTRITSPDFSYKRKKDLESLIKLITQRIKIREESLTYNEQDALFLTLKKYVNLNNLISRLREYDEELLEHYKREKVGFSNGKTINFDLNDSEKIFNQIADRIYKTRNSIVHSKELGKPRYIPFRDDRKLIMEIPLIRFISEEIIINSSEILQ